jgi:hypothetical protein
MTDDRLPGPSGKPAFIKKMGPWLLMILSAIIGILLVELFCRLFVPSIGRAQGVQNWNQRAIFFDGPDTIFENHGDIFTYVPHTDIRNVTAFFSEDDFSIEYDYHFRTNNFGLVQDADIMTERETLLLLGDSFTEGQGADPWFRLVSPKIDELGYQAVNGGLLATGFQQWLKLERYLAGKELRIRKLVVLFISDDYRRPITHIPPAVLRCLSAPPLCREEESYFYRLPPREELSLWIAKVRTARGPELIWFKARAAALLPASYSVYKYFSMSKHFERAEQESHAAIGELIGTYGPENVAFIHLPQKDEISTGPNSIGSKARRSIQEERGRLYDGFKLCRLTATDYYPNDDHPNSGGYAKIAACVNNIIKEMVAGAR